MSQERVKPKHHELTLATRRDSRNFFQRLLFEADDIHTYVSVNIMDDIRTYKSSDIIQRYPHLCSSIENVWTHV